MGLNNLSFFRIKLAWLAENRIRNGQFSHIVKLGGKLNPTDVVVAFPISSAIIAE